MNEDQCREKAKNKFLSKVGYAATIYVTAAFGAARMAARGTRRAMIAATITMLSRHVVFWQTFVIAYARYRWALYGCEPVSPLILDLDGDGVEAGALAFFDHEGDGFAEATRWAGADDGVLVWDRNGNGKIDDGGELFGNNTALANGQKAVHGFAALSELDANNDGVVDSADANFANLRVLRWTDANKNGMMDAGEERLETLSAAGVRSLKTAFVSSTKVDAAGNEHRQVGSFVKADGTTSEMTDVWFATSPDAATYSRAGIPAHSESIKGLPELAGQGRLYSLRDAMALDAAGRLTAPFYGNARTETRTLEQLVSAFGASGMSSDKSGRKALAEKILLRWAGAEGAVSSDYWNSAGFGGGKVTPQQLAVVEAFMGRQWRAGQSYRNPASSTADKINRIYDGHLERLYGGLMLQTHLKDLSGGITISLKEGAESGSTDIGDYKMDLSRAKAILDGESNARRNKFLRAMVSVYGETDFLLSAMKAADPRWMHEAGYLLADVRGEVIRGTSSSESLLGASGRADIFDSAAGGNDRLYGYGGDDVYWLGRGTGHDIVEEGYGNSGSGDAGDEVRIKAGIGSSLVRLERDKNHLYVRVLGAGGTVTDSLKVQDYYASAKSRVERVLFADGTVWGSGKLDAVRLRGTSKNDSLFGVSGHADHFDGDAGGTDTLYGVGGDDVYWLGRGTGHDVIDEGLFNPSVTGDSGDEVRVKSGVSRSSVDLLRSKDGNHLYVRVLGVGGVATDSLKVKDYYTSAKAKVERVVFVDGTVWDATKLDGASYERYRGGSGDDSLFGNSRVNHFDGDAGGNDTLYGEGGNDVYWLGRGTGHDVVDESFWNSLLGDSGDEVRVKSGVSRSSVDLLRSKDGNHLYVRVLGVGGVATDSLKVKDYYTSAKAKVERVVFADGKAWDAATLDGASYERYRGGSGDDSLFGNSRVNHFDGDAGGNDTLYGEGGNDVYWLGRGTGHDVVDESFWNSPLGDSGDKIRVKSGVSRSLVDLLRSKDGADLYVRVLGTNGVATDSLRVKGYYTSAKAKVESVVFTDGTVWDATKLDGASYERYRGGSGADSLSGNDSVNHFDGDAGGDDTLYGQKGDDVYWLGRGTGHDVVDESFWNSVAGDTGDEIRLKSGIVESDVRWERVGDHLYVRVLGSDGVATDSLKVSGYYASARARVERVVFADGTVWGLAKMGVLRHRGGSGVDVLHGNASLADTFDGDAGGDDTLRGYSGNDVYWLGRGTGHDVVDEGYGNAGSGDTGDEIRVKSGIGESSVRLERDRKSLYIRLLGANDAVTDSLKVKDYYASAKSRVERVVFADGTVWGSAKMDALRLHGTSGADVLYGNAGRADIFDGDAGGDDTLRGYSGDDVYWLGRGTGHDVVDEGYGNSGLGDTGDEIRLKSGIGTADVRMERDGEHLYVRVLGTNGAVTDSLKVKDYYAPAKSRVERVVFADGTVWGSAKMDAFATRLRGTSRNDSVYGNAYRVDTFDADAGGDDNLYGYGGDDVYWLGRGTGHDVVYDGHRNSGTGDAGDKIRVKSGVLRSSVDLLRSKDGADLYVRVLGANGAVTDSLRVAWYYTSAKYRVESVVFADGTVWDSSRLDAAVHERYRGGAGVDSLHGNDRVNHFDGDAGGNDNLYGYGGDDVYWLGRGTGHDVVYDGHRNSGTGDAGDKIRVKAGIVPKSVDLLRSKDGADLYVRVLGANGAVTDSLRVAWYYTSAKYRVESVVFADGTVWDSSRLDAAVHERYRGGAGVDSLRGNDRVNHFDGDAGGNDNLYGYGGDDVYWLGRGTGHDVVYDGHRNSGTGDAGDKIRVKAGIVPKSVDLLRSKDGADLYVRVLGANGAVTDSLRVAWYYTSAKYRVESVVFADGTVWDSSRLDAAVHERYRGGAGVDSLRGNVRVNHFDGDAGGNDRLYGYGGDDVYWLGRGTGHDIVDDGHRNSGTGDAGDKIRVKSGVLRSSVDLLRSKDGADLYVRVLGANGAVTDSLRVVGYYTSAKYRVESVVFADGTVWDSSRLDAAVHERYRGGAGADSLHGNVRVNHFDGDAGGNDRLYGYGGDDVYWLGRGTGHDVVDEGHRNSGAGDVGDEIRVKSGIGVADVRLRRVGGDLYVDALGVSGTATDSLKVEGHYTSEKSRVESIHAAGKVLLASQYLSLMHEMALFDAGNSQFSDMNSLLGRFWQDESTLAAPSGSG